MRRINFFKWPVAFLLIFCNKISVGQNTNERRPHNILAGIDLSGEWRFAIDSLDIGIEQAWFNKNLADKIILPGSMTTNGKGNDITADTKWTGNLFNIVWFKNTAWR
jgi:hypothetical protein